MTEQVVPFIKGTLPRGRHFVYQWILATLYIIAFAIHPKVGFIALLVTIVPTWYFVVQRLHDAGYNGGWSLPMMALEVIIFFLYQGYFPLGDKPVSVGQFGLGDILAAGLTAIEYFWAIQQAGIGILVWFIVICALPTKKDDNPYKPKKKPEEYSRTAPPPPPIPKPKDSPPERRAAATTDDGSRRRATDFIPPPE